METQALPKTVYEIRSEIVHNGKLLSDEGVRREVERHGSVVAKDFPHTCESVASDVLRDPSCASPQVVQLQAWVKNLIGKYCWD